MVVGVSRVAAIRNFVKFKWGVIKEINSTEFNFKPRVEQLFETLVVEVCQPIFGEDWRDLVESAFDYKKWLGEFVSRNSHSPLGFKLDVLDKHLLHLIEQSSLPNLKNWEEFCRKHLSGYDLTKALLTIATRVKNIDKRHSLELVQEAINSNKDFFYTYGSQATTPLLNLLFELDVHRAKEALLNGFNHQYKQYPMEIIYHLDQVLEYADYFVGPEIYGFIYEEYEQYNVRLVEGLTKKETNYAGLEGFETEGPFEAAIVQYLLRLFDYPEVEVRRLALASLFDFIKSDNRLLSVGFNLSIAAQENVVEHFLSLVYSLALHDYNLVLAHKESLLAYVEIPHFNIRQSVKEILMYCVEQGGAFTLGELRKLEAINAKPQLTIPTVIEGALRRGRKFIPCSYQTELMRQLFLHHPDDNIADKIYTRLLQLGWSSTTGIEQEGEVLRAHNINVNFDAIEINGPYFQAVQK